jgi:hypothetical protein
VSTYELGQTITFTVQVVDDNGTAADLGGGNPTCTVTKPDGTTTTATVSKPSGAGLYWGSVASSSQAGRWRGTFTGTGTNSGRLPFTDVVDVWPADPRLIISLDDAKAELNHVQDVNDDELRLYIAATTEIVEHLVGRVLSTSLTETFNGGKTAVLLSERATAITSLTVDGVALTASEYVADLSSGIVYAGSASTPYCFTYGRQNVVVTYTTGASSIAPSVIGGARTIAAHLYASSQQSRRGRGRSGDGDGTTLVLGYAIPNAAIEKLSNQRHNRMPGIA